MANDEKIRFQMAELESLVMMLREHATEGHMPYVVDALELIVELLKATHEPSNH